MKIDFLDHLGAMQRSVSTVQRDGKDAYAVTISRTYATDVTDLWDALTNQERIPRWFLPVAGDLRLGGRFQLEGNAAGEILACERPAYLSVTWEFAGDVSWVEVRLKAEDAGCRFSLTHTARPSPHWKQYGPGAAGVGWELGFLGLHLHLTEPGSAKFDETALIGNEAGKAYIRGCSEGWRDASIAFGTDRVEAVAACGQTSAFYTGDPI